MCFFMPEVSSVFFFFFFFHQFINSQVLQKLSTRAFQGLLSDDIILNNMPNMQQQEPLNPEAAKLSVSSSYKIKVWKLSKEMH